MPLRPLNAADRDSVYDLLRKNPHKRDQIDAQDLDPNKLARFHCERTFGRAESESSPVFVFEGKEDRGIVGFREESHHSQFFGKPVFSLDPVISYRLSSEEKATSLRDLVALLPARDEMVLWARCDETEGDLVRALTRIGAEYCGSDVRLSRRLDDSGAEIEEEGPVGLREGGSKNLQAVREVAASSHRHSHFFRDPHLPTEKKSELFPRYLERVWGSETRPCRVAVDESGKVLGFSLLLEPRGQEETLGRKIGIIDFIAVAPGSQGLGVGKALLDDSFRRLRANGYEWVELKTTLDNRTALKFYSRQGFAPVSTEMRFSALVGEKGKERR